MKKIDLGQAISILANLGVLAGIVFLAIELQQNNKLLQAEAIGVVLETRIARNEVIANNEGLAALITKNQRGDPLTDIELTRIRSMHARTILGWERDYLLFREGIMDREQLEANIPIMREAFRTNTSVSFGMGDYWDDSGRSRATAAFREFVDSCVAEGCDLFP